MVCISSITVRDSRRYHRMGLRSALLTRRANLGDCVDARSVFRRMASNRYMGYPACVIPLTSPRRGEISAAGLALDVSRRALLDADAMPADAYGALIYCHAVPDERTSDSTAGHLQFELGLTRANPFSVSQAHNTALLIGLDLAAGLVEGPEAAAAVLLVASDKLMFGAPPTRAQRMTWGDVAAAAVVSREAQSGWKVHRVVLRHFATNFGTHQRWPDGEQRAFAAYCADALATCLRDAGVRPGELAAIISTAPDANFVQQVHQSAGLPMAAPGARDKARARHAASPDLLLRLAKLQEGFAPTRPVMAWCNGNNGEFACCLLTRIA